MSVCVAAGVFGCFGGRRRNLCAAGLKVSCLSRVRRVGARPACVALTLSARYDCIHPLRRSCPSPPPPSQACCIATTSSSSSTATAITTANESPKHLPPHPPPRSPAHRPCPRNAVPPAPRTLIRPLRQPLWSSHIPPAAAAATFRRLQPRLLCRPHDGPDGLQRSPRRYVRRSRYRRKERERRHRHPTLPTTTLNTQSPPKIVKSLPLLHKTLLRRLQPLRNPQAAHPPEPLAPCSLVTPINRPRLSPALRRG